MKPRFFQLPEEKRRRITRAAQREFGLQDFDAASLDRIVQEARISKGGLYEYISGKDELYLYCMELTWKELYETLGLRFKTEGRSFPRDLLERFGATARYAIDWYLEHPWLLGLLVRTARLPREALSQKVEAVFENHFSALMDGVDSSGITCDLGKVETLIKWFLSKTRKEVFEMITAGAGPEAIRRAYLEDWDFFCGALSRGIYQPGP